MQVTFAVVCGSNPTLLITNQMKALSSAVHSHGADGFSPFSQNEIWDFFLKFDFGCWAVLLEMKDYDSM